MTGREAAPADEKILPQVTVVTVNLNHAAGLERTMKSLSAQGNVDWESVIVDGGSTDGSIEAAESFKARVGSERVRVTSRSDRGVYDAMNMGLADARGVYSVFMNSGDTFHDDNSLAVMVAGLKDSGGAWGYGRIHLLSGSLVPEEIRGFEPFDLRALALGRRTVPHQAAVFRTAELRDLEGYGLGWGVAADQELMFRLALRHTPNVWPRVLADFESGGMGSSRPPSALPLDFYRMRRSAGYRIGPGAWSDLLSTAAVIAFAVVAHATWRLGERWGWVGRGRALLKGLVRSS